MKKILSILITTVIGLITFFLLSYFFNKEKIHDTLHKEQTKKESNKSTKNNKIEKKDSISSENRKDVTIIPFINSNEIKMLKDIKNAQTYLNNFNKDNYAIDYHKRKLENHLKKDAKTNEIRALITSTINLLNFEEKKLKNIQQPPNTMNSTKNDSITKNDTLNKINILKKDSLK